MKHGIRVATVYFEYESNRHRSFASDRLLTASNYTLNIVEIEKDRKDQGLFRSLFRQIDKGKDIQEHMFEVPF
jgi:hypothetical protein